MFGVIYFPLRCNIVALKMVRITKILQAWETFLGLGQVSSRIQQQARGTNDISMLNNLWFSWLIVWPLIMKINLSSNLPHTELMCFKTLTGRFNSVPRDSAFLEANSQASRNVSSDLFRTYFNCAISEMLIYYKYITMICNAQEKNFCVERRNWRSFKNISHKNHSRWGRISTLPGDISCRVWHTASRSSTVTITHTFMTLKPSCWEQLYKFCFVWFCSMYTNHSTPRL